MLITYTKDELPPKECSYKVFLKRERLETLTIKTRYVTYVFSTSQTRLSNLYLAKIHPILRNLVEEFHMTWREGSMWGGDLALGDTPMMHVFSHRHEVIFQVYDHPIAKILLEKLIGTLGAWPLKP